MRSVPDQTSLGTIGISAGEKVTWFSIDETTDAKASSSLKQLLGIGYLSPEVGSIPYSLTYLLTWNCGTYQ